MNNNNIWGTPQESRTDPKAKNNNNTIFNKTWTDPKAKNV